FEMKGRFLLCYVIVLEIGARVSIRSSLVQNRLSRARPLTRTAEHCRAIVVAGATTLGCISAHAVVSRSLQLRTDDTRKEYAIGFLQDLLACIVLHEETGPGDAVTG